MSGSDVHAPGADISALPQKLSCYRFWILGLQELRKPLLHLHTQYNVEIPYDTIDMDFMKLRPPLQGVVATNITDAIIKSIFLHSKTASVLLPGERYPLIISESPPTPSQASVSQPLF